MACFETGRQFHCLLLYQGKIATDRLAGIREGTVIAALLVGFIDRLIGKKLAFLKDMIFPESVSAENKNEAKEQTAGTTGYTPEFVKKNEEIMTNSLLYDLVNQMYLNTDRMKRRRIKFLRQNARLYAILRKKAIA